MEFLITQVLFLSIALGTSFYSVHGATLHGQKSEALHYIVAVTGDREPAVHRAVDVESTQGDDSRITADGRALGVCAAIAALIADYSGAEALPILSGVVIVFAAAGAAATSSTRSTWMYHNLGQENDTEVIIFCQVVLGSPLQPSDSSSACSLASTQWRRHGHAHPVRLRPHPCAKRTPVRIAELHPDHVHSNHGRHFGGFHW